MQMVQHYNQFLDGLIEIRKSLKPSQEIWMIRYQEDILSFLCD